MPSSDRSSISITTAHDIVRVWNLPQMHCQKDVFEYLGLSTDSGTMTFYRQQAEEITGKTLLPHTNKSNYVTRTERENLPPLTNQIDVSKNPYTMVVFSDAHFEGHETPSYKILLKIIKELTLTRELKCVVANGDIMDMSILSSFAKFHTEIRPKERTVQQEILDSQKQINKIQKVINNAKYPIKQIATFGNHETRISKVAMSWGRAFEDLEAFKIQNLFPDWCWAMSHLLDDTVMIKHRMRGGVHTAYQNSMRAGIHIVTGHTHQLNARTFNTYSTSSMSIQTGHLSEAYHPYLEDNVANDWNNGFAVITVDPKEKTVHPELVQVSNYHGTAYFRGKKYKA
jgi:hypothetical protein|tara:strand:- start:2618 stop:3643 length:1026 start_codon:yes stop_codon:yes gene_type:complete